MINRKHTQVIFSSIIIILILFITFQNPVFSSQNEKFDPQSKKELIIELGKKWSEGIKKQDLSILSNIYDKDGIYFPTNYKTLYGNDEITEYWGKILKFMIDIRLNIKTLDGTKEILIESGDGIGTYYSSETKMDTVLFNYVNVWKLQPDGNYKAIIDIYKENKVLKKE